MSHSSAHFPALVVLVLVGPRFRSRILCEGQTAIHDALTERILTGLRRRYPMFATEWLAKVALVALAWVFLSTEITLAEDLVWQKAIKDGKQLRDEGRYKEAEKAILFGLVEAEKLGPDDYRAAVSLNELAALYHGTGRLSEAEQLYRRALAIWERLP